MKKLMLVVVLLAFVASTWGLTAKADGSDEAYIQLTVCMVGIEFSIYDDGAFDERGTGDDGYTYVSDVSSPEIMHGSMTGSCMQPCAINNIVFGLENTGGITIDINAYEGTYVYSGGGTVALESWTSEDGTNPDLLECIGLGEGEYKILTGGVFPTLGDAGVHTAPAAWDNMNGVLVGAPDEIISALVAEDAAVPGDGSWTLGQDDVADLYVGLVAPSTVRSVNSADGPHTIEVVYLATVAD